MIYQGQEIIELTSAYQAINRYETERQRVERASKKQSAGSLLHSLVGKLLKLLPSERRSALEQEFQHLARN
jgi:hypothetical protein